MAERLQRALARAGIASRRQAEAIISQGRVRVNGERITTMGFLVNVDIDLIQVDDRPISIPASREYWKLNKPVGVVSTARDDRGRTTVVDLIPSRRRLYPVGRLDLDSEGLMLLTDDGEVAQLLMHPSHQHTKEYRVLVSGSPSPSALARLEQGIVLEDGPAAVDSVQLGPEEDGKRWLAITLHQGKKRQIRRMMDALGHRVVRLMRTRIGPIELGDLAPGTAARLNGQEIEALDALKRG